uniref:Uncharacterized protein n=1 Tax=Glossina austeni TaxID=7395 RepID=A0A1A9UNY1_GLOAU
MPTLLCLNGSYPGSCVVGSVGSWMVRQAVAVEESLQWPLAFASHGFPCSYLFYRFILVSFDSQPNANKATHSAETHDSRPIPERHSAHHSLYLRSITFCRVGYQWNLRWGLHLHRNRRKIQFSFPFPFESNYVTKYNKLCKLNQASIAALFVKKDKPRYTNLRWEEGLKIVVARIQQFQSTPLLGLLLCWVCYGSGICDRFVLTAIATCAVDVHVGVVLVFVKVDVAAVISDVNSNDVGIIIAIVVDVADVNICGVTATTDDSPSKVAYWRKSVAALRWADRGMSLNNCKIFWPLFARVRWYGTGFLTKRDSHLCPLGCDDGGLVAGGIIFHGPSVALPGLVANALTHTSTRGLLTGLHSHPVVAVDDFVEDALLVFYFFGLRYTTKLSFKTNETA